MKRAVLYSGALLALAQFSASADRSPESLRGGQTAAFDAAAAAIPVTVTGTPLRCQAGMRHYGSGYNAACPGGTVVTGVTLANGLALLNCGQVVVTCN